MKIGEIAKAAGVTTSRIRFYEREGIIPPADRGANGYRDYDAGLVALLQFIEQAQSLGFTLREIGDIGMGLNEDIGQHIISCTEARGLLAQKRDSITKLIAEAEDRRARIEALMVQLEASQQAQLQRVG